MLRLFRHYVSLKVLALLLGDGLILVWSVYAAMWLRAWGDSAWMANFQPFFPKALVLACMVLFSMHLFGLYTLEPGMGRKRLVVSIVAAYAIATLWLGALYYFIPALKLWRGVFVMAGTLSLALVVQWRLLAQWMFSSPQLASRVLILGSGSAACLLDHALSRISLPGINVVGFIDSEKDGARAVPASKILPKRESLYHIARRERVGKIVVALSERRGTLPLKDILVCKVMGIEVLDLPTFYEQVTGKILLKDLRPSWLIFSDGFRVSNTTKAVKRLTDILLAIVGLVLASPVMLLVALAIKLDSRGPVFFKQKRVGERGRVFTLIKFRTMREDAEAQSGPVWAGEEDPRVTRVGRFLRKTRLDELPQMWNVLKGDMSFVGPRPERPCFVERLQEQIPFYTQRLVVKPGITGWAQVRYRYGGSVEDALEKLQYDLYYIKNMSLFLDFLICIDTVRVMLAGQGAR